MPGPVSGRRARDSPLALNLELSPTIKICRLQLGPQKLLFTFHIVHSTMNNMKIEQKLKVFYDGLCKVCSAEIAHYQKQQGSENIEFIDICSGYFNASAEGLNPIEAHKVMHVRRTDGSMAIRVDAFIEIWKVLPKFKWLARLAQKPLVRFGLDAGYNLFSQIRPWLPRKQAANDCSNSPYCEVKMHKLPVDFFSEVYATGEFEKPWSINSRAQQADCAIPPEFGGTGDGFSPEDLFLQSLMNCFTGTFKVYAKASRISFSSLSIKGQLIVDQDATKKVFMKTVHLDIEIRTEDRPHRIETIVAKTLRDGFILNSVKSEIFHKLAILTNSSENCFKNL